MWEGQEEAMPQYTCILLPILFDDSCTRADLILFLQV